MKALGLAKAQRPPCVSSIECAIAHSMTNRLSDLAVCNENDVFEAKSRLVRGERWFHLADQEGQTAVGQVRVLPALLGRW